MQWRPSIYNFVNKSHPIIKLFKAANDHSIDMNLDFLCGPVDEDVEWPDYAGDGDHVEGDAAEELAPLQRRHVKLLPLAERLHLKF